MPTTTSPAPMAAPFPGAMDTRASAPVPHTIGLDCYSILADIEHCAVCGTYIPDPDEGRDLDFEIDMAEANAEPDWEAMAQARQEAREAAYLDRMDRRY